jgi:hypothetical protein
MRRVLRENAVCTVIAAGCCASLGWLGLYGYGWNDYDNEARVAVDALVHGHFAEFARLAPAYAGSLLERAPFALLPTAWDGGDLAIYRMLALPCLLAAAVLGIWLCARMRADGRPRVDRAIALGLCVANPIFLPALEMGHPEELLGGCLALAAVLLAGASGARPRPLLAGVALGLAVANKPWAALAAGPVLLALPTGARARCVVAAAAVAAAVLAPIALSSSSYIAATRATASQVSPIFQPWQVWWFLGHHGPLVHGLFGTPKPGYRVAPPWTGAVARPLVLLCGIAISALLWRRRRPLGASEALLALALLLLLRCLLDTWDNVYYTIPFVLALLLWEVRARRERIPLLACAATALVWISFKWLPDRASADVQSAFFICWSLPLAVWLAQKLRGAGPRAAGAQDTTVSSLGRLVRASLSLSPTTTRSSIRTPSSPGT